MKKIFLFLILICCPFFVFSQDDAKKEKMFREVREWKMKYLAQEMKLTDDQKTKFFELYSEMTKERDECFKNAREKERKLKKDSDKASEEDYQEMREAMNKANIEDAEIEKRYDEKFSEFLSQKQIYEMKEAEKNFREKLEEMRHEKRKQHRKGEKK